MGYGVVLSVHVYLLSESWGRTLIVTQSNNSNKMLQTFWAKWSTPSEWAMKTELKTGVSLFLLDLFKRMTSSGAIHRSKFWIAQRFVNAVSAIFAMLRTTVRYASLLKVKRLYFVKQNHYANKSLIWWYKAISRSRQIDMKVLTV